VIKDRKETAAGYLFLLPALGGILVFILGPVVAAIALSFTKWDLLTPAKFIGLSNYQELIQDPMFRKVMLNTLIFTGASVPLSLILSLGLALALNQKIKGIVIFRTIYFLPVVSSMVAVSLVWRWLYNPNYGLLNYFLNLLHLPSVNWLFSTTWAMPAVILMSVWKGLGYNMVIFLAGLQGIPQMYYESAKIDGAGKFQAFKNITLPLLSPTTFFVLVISIISSFQVFDQIFVMTSGGPAHATEVIIYYIYHNAFQIFRMGYASALAFCLFIIIFALTLLQIRLSKRWVFY